MKKEIHERLSVSIESYTRFNVSSIQWPKFLYLFLCC